MDFFHAAALVPATIGTCCTLGVRRRGMAPQMIGSVAMLVAMADAVLGWGLLAPVAWAGILLVLAITVGAAARPHPRDTTDDGHPDVVMAVLAGLGLVTMAGMVLAMGAGRGVSGGGAHEHPLALIPVLLCAGLGYAGFAVWAARRLPREAAVPRVEVLSMGLSSSVMAGMLL